MRFRRWQVSPPPGHATACGEQARPSRPPGSSTTVAWAGLAWPPENSWPGGRPTPAKADLIELLRLLDQARAPGVVNSPREESAC
ncbi:hypothetical protein ACFV2N_36915 [Streptomyces sp. NPDC059680]|uniref:hypothetical protein n=1 Tax=Streptomyces sp. NPDC059680 TaxID=3346904 RepID=UPI00369E8CE1